MKRRTTILTVSALLVMVGWGVFRWIYPSLDNAKAFAEKERAHFFEVHGRASNWVDAAELDREFSQEYARTMALLEAWQENLRLEDGSLANWIALRSIKCNPLRVGKGIHYSRRKVLPLPDEFEGQLLEITTPLVDSMMQRSGNRPWSLECKNWYSSGFGFVVGAILYYAEKQTAQEHAGIIERLWETLNNSLTGPGILAFDQETMVGSWLLRLLMDPAAGHARDPQLQVRTEEGVIHSLMTLMEFNAECERDLELEDFWKTPDGDSLEHRLKSNQRRCDECYKYGEAWRFATDYLPMLASDLRGAAREFLWERSITSLKSTTLSGIVVDDLKQELLVTLSPLIFETARKIQAGEVIPSTIGPASEPFGYCTLEGRMLTITLDKNVELVRQVHRYEEFLGAKGWHFNGASFTELLEFPLWDDPEDDQRRVNAEEAERAKQESALASRSGAARSRRRH